jgi:hypothetical protein
MNSQRAIRRALSLMLALSVTLWAETGLGMLPAAGHGSQCHTQMAHMHQQASLMPCCPSHSVSVPANFFAPPPCCDMSKQPARPVAYLATSGKSQSNKLRASSGGSLVSAPLQRESAFLLTAASPPFVKPVLDLKTDLRI